TPRSPRRPFSSTRPAPPATCPLSLHDALPISLLERLRADYAHDEGVAVFAAPSGPEWVTDETWEAVGAWTKQHGVPLHTHCLERSEEHTSELQSRENLVCRLLLEKKKQPECRR